MTDDAERHHRRSIRLRGYDYSQAGAYFVTVCAQGRACQFGEVAEGGMRLNDAGQMVDVVWRELPDRFPGVRLDEFVVMPNHIHGIITLVGAQFIAPLSRADVRDLAVTTEGGAINRAPTLGNVVRAFKAVSTRTIRAGIDPRFAWQRNYHEHIIRGEESLNRIRQYILDNPAQWAFDRENPHALAPEPGETWRA